MEEPGLLRNVQGWDIRPSQCTSARAEWRKGVVCSLWKLWVGWEIRESNCGKSVLQAVGKNAWGDSSVWVMTCIKARGKAGEEFLIIWPHMSWAMGAWLVLATTTLSSCKCQRAFCKARAPWCVFSLFHVLVSEHKYVTTKMLMNSSHWRPSLHIRTYKQFATHTQTLLPKRYATPAPSRREKSLHRNLNFDCSSPSSSKPDKYMGPTDTKYRHVRVVGLLWAP